MDSVRRTFEQLSSEARALTNRFPQNAIDTVRVMYSRGAHKSPAALVCLGFILGMAVSFLVFRRRREDIAAILHREYGSVVERLKSDIEVIDKKITSSKKLDASLLRFLKYYVPSIIVLGGVALKYIRPTFLAAMPYPLLLLVPIPLVMALRKIIVVRLRSNWATRKKKSTELEKLGKEIAGKIPMDTLQLLQRTGEKNKEQKAAAAAARQSTAASRATDLKTKKLVELISRFLTLQLKDTDYNKKLIDYLQIELRTHVPELSDGGAPTPAKRPPSPADYANAPASAVKAQRPGHFKDDESASSTVDCGEDNPVTPGQDTFATPALKDVSSVKKRAAASAAKDVE